MRQAAMLTTTVRTTSRTTGNQELYAQPGAMAQGQGLTYAHAASPGGDYPDTELRSTAGKAGVGFNLQSAKREGPAGTG